MTTALFLLRCTQLGLSVADLEFLTIGMITDMYNEASEDATDKPENNVREATQADINRYF